MFFCHVHLGRGWGIGDCPAMRWGVTAPTPHSWKQSSQHLFASTVSIPVDLQLAYNKIHFIAQLHLMPFFWRLCFCIIGSSEREGVALVYTGELHMFWHPNHQGVKEKNWYKRLKSAWSCYRSICPSLRENHSFFLLQCSLWQNERMVFPSSSETLQ